MPNRGKRVEIPGYESHSREGELLVIHLASFDGAACGLANPVMTADYDAYKSITCLRCKASKEWREAHNARLAKQWNEE